MVAVIAERQIVPPRSKLVPTTSGHLRRLDHDIKNPVETPAMVADAEGTMRWRPESVADSRRTAWKYKGILKRTALTIMAARKLQKMMLERGDWKIILRGMMGSGTRLSQ
jgi:hypothetical protein